MTWLEHLQLADWLRGTVCALGAYLLGCFATGYYLVRLRTGRDVREIGSGSIGARNVGRVLGATGFVVTLLGDFGKGVLAVWAAYEFTHNHRLAALAMLAVVVGHIWPAQLRFRGGKGAATSLGALLLFDPRLALIFVVLFLAGFVMLRKTVVPAMFAFACLPLAGLWFGRSGLTMTLVGVLSAIILLAHRRNLVEEITALMARREVAPKPE
jgi:glycerol-3-phosphate acyltransferase PlsY